MLTVIRDGKFTGVQYNEIKPNILKHHHDKNEKLVWIERKLERDEEGEITEEPTEEDLENEVTEAPDTRQMMRKITDMMPIDLKTDKQQIETNGTDTAIITGEVPEHIEKAYVLVNSPPPVHEVINDGEIEIEFTTEDEGYHVIEVTAGNHRGLAVIKGVNE